MILKALIILRESGNFWIHSVSNLDTELDTDNKYYPLFEDEKSLDSGQAEYVRKWASQVELRVRTLYL